MTNWELIDKHRGDCGGCSFLGQMKNWSSTYTQIIEKGEEIIPDIIKYLKDEGGGMSIILLLMNIVKERPFPYEPGLIEGIGYGSWDVKQAREAWIKWFENKVNENIL